MLLYKTIPQGMISHGHKWEVGKWYKHEGELKLCPTNKEAKQGIGGFHASRLIPQAFSYVVPYWVCKVEVGEEVIIGDDKVVAHRMRILKKYRWTKKDSVAFAVWCARRCLKNFERLYPDDKRPRRAVEAAEKYLLNPCKKTKDAAASAERSAVSAARGVWSAASAASAERDARNAVSAARSAARSAASAERDAWSAAWSAASAAKRAQHKKILRMIKKRGG